VNSVRAVSSVIEVTGLTKRYRGVTAVNDVSFALEGPGIHGLLGRNGAGKTTLMQLISGQEFASAGSLKVFGEHPVENAAVLTRMCFIKESQVYPDGFKARHVLRAAPWFFANWNQELADQLVEDFRLPLNRVVKKMSRGQKSSLGAIIGIASRAELTLLDEPYAGLDAVARRLFYDRLLADYAEHPRTIVLSTHLIDEAADLLERVVVIDSGQIVINELADDLRGSATTLAGRAADVDAFAAGKEVIDRSRLGGLATITVLGLTPADKAAAAKAGLESSPVSLQQLIVRRTGAHMEQELAS
jgi:ABC-2 type transport system ATP-binding protein